MSCWDNSSLVKLYRTFDTLHLACARATGETEVVATDKRLRDVVKRFDFSLLQR